jgi:hypothetical protein
MFGGVSGVNEYEWIQMKMKSGKNSEVISHGNNSLVQSEREEK